MTKTYLLMTAAAALLLSGCEARTPLNDEFGNAVEQNLSLQIVDPDPVYIAPESPDFNGIRASGAIDRYETGTVIEPEEETTTSGVN